MYTTFTSDQPSSPSLLQSRETSTPKAPVRPKRSQVARACDWCRVHRIKCDTNQPCSNCRNRGGQCHNERTEEVRTFPSAIREVERLRLRIKELEQQLQRCDGCSNNKLASSSATTTSSSISNPADSDPFSSYMVKKRVWEGIYTSTTQSNQTQCYGPSSAFYFIGRMTSYLATALQQPQLDYSIQPNSASRSFASPISRRKGHPEATIVSSKDSITEDYLTGIQEEFFLDLFWQSYHCTYQIIDESQFKEHYKSLWIPSATSRKQSALVDVVLALCMQFGISYLPRNDAISKLKTNVDSNDATIAGRWYYRRSQKLLMAELESPSISTLQCHILSVVYLCNASFQNMAHSALALAVRTAHILGLHLEPARDMLRSQKELRKRLWWTLYAVEIKTCMKLGRPWSAQMSQVTCTLPADDHELALLSGSNFASFGNNVTWFSYSLQSTKLILAARAVYVAFYDKCAAVLAVNNGKSLYDDHQSLETCADCLLMNIEGLQIWLQDVPDALKTKRKNGGDPFSTDRSVLDVELFAPLWLQRQRLLLELLYHNLSMNLYRPFICFTSTSAGRTPVAESHAVSCVNHAMAITYITHQILTQTDILSGWHEVFQWQWNAALSMIGFVLAYPVGLSSPTVRQTIQSAIEVFENFGKNFAIAASAANVTRDLIVKADILIHRYQSNLTTPVISTAHDSAFEMYDNSAPFDGHMPIMPPTSQAGSPPATGQIGLADSLGLAFTVESFNSFEPLDSDTNNMFDTWIFSQD